jgi:quercetin dioxygenase-like cupin family protein
MGILKRDEITPEVFGKGRTRYLAHTDNLMMVVADFSGGPAAEPDPPHSHPHEQITYVAEGEVYFFVDGKPVRVGPGDVIAVPSDTPHNIQLLTERARLVDVFHPLRGDFLA